VKEQVKEQQEVTPAGKCSEGRESQRDKQALERGRSPPDSTSAKCSERAARWKDLILGGLPPTKLIDEPHDANDLSLNEVP
jgi:hypothetical protein